MRRFSRRHYAVLWIELLLVSAISGLYAMANRTADEPYREVMAYVGGGLEPAGRGDEAAGSRDGVHARVPGPLQLRELAALLGMTRAELPAFLGEPPVPAAGGGLAFNRAGVRVWFDDDTHTRVTRVLVLSDEIDLNGARLGDGITDFIRVFGEPLCDRNGDARFPYGQIYLSAVYDTTTGKTAALYLLSENTSS